MSKERQSIHTTCCVAAGGSAVVQSRRWLLGLLALLAWVVLAGHGQDLPEPAPGDLAAYSATAVTQCEAESGKTASPPVEFSMECEWALPLALSTPVKSNFSLNLPFNLRVWQFDVPPPLPPPRLRA